MRLILLILIIFYWAFIAEAETNFCELSKDKQKALIECSENFKFHQCEQLLESGTDKNLVNFCDSQGPSGVDSIADAAGFCGKGLKEAVEGIPAAAKAFKDWMFLEGDNDAHIGDYKICNERRTEEASVWDSTKFVTCIRGVQAQNLYKKVKSFVKDEEGIRTQAMDSIFRATHCYKKEAYAKTLCPMIVEFAAGTFAGPALKAAGRLSPGPARVRTQLSGIDHSSKEYLDKIADMAKSPAEIKSAAHQADLIAATKNPALAKLIDKAKLDLNALHNGMLDSDLGKNSGFSQARLMDASPESNELFDALKGQGKAGQAISEAMAKSGQNGTSLLNPKLTNTEIREVFRQAPPLGGYMHELPGMQVAIRLFNQGKISKADFQARILANYGHNGPDEGFWKVMSEGIVPGTLKGNANAKDFFKNTVFEGGRNKDGVVVPRYPSPTTAEGMFHTTMDRLSQGTSGGMDKIFSELGGKVYKENPKIPLGQLGFPPNKGLFILDEMLGGNPKKTLDQLDRLKSHNLTLKGIDQTQREAIAEMISMAEKRIHLQNEFIKKNVTVNYQADGKTIKDILINTTDANGRPVRRKFDLNSSADDAHAAMNSLMEQEKRLHGDAIADLGKVPTKVKPVVPVYSLAQCSRSGGNTNSRSASGVR